jgi:hypothetical protein
MDRCGFCGTEIPATAIPFVLGDQPACGKCWESRKKIEVVPEEPISDVWLENISPVAAIKLGFFFGIGFGVFCLICLFFYGVFSNIR